jgi:hypothetical protein
MLFYFFALSKAKIESLVSTLKEKVMILLFFMQPMARWVLGLVKYLE